MEGYQISPLSLLEDVRRGRLGLARRVRVRQAVTENDLEIADLD